MEQAMLGLDGSLATVSCSTNSRCRGADVVPRHSERDVNVRLITNLKLMNYDWRKVQGSKGRVDC